MLHMLMVAWAWLMAHPWDALARLAQVLTAVSIVVGMLPERAQAWPVLGFAVRFGAWLGYLLHSDQPGTVKMPGPLALMLRAAQAAYARVSLPSAAPKLVVVGSLCASLAACAPGSSQAGQVTPGRVWNGVRAVCGWVLRLPAAADPSPIPGPSDAGASGGESAPLPAP